MSALSSLAFKVHFNFNELISIPPSVEYCSKIVSFRDLGILHPGCGGDIAEPPIIAVY